MLLSSFWRSSSLTRTRFLNRWKSDFPSGCGWEEIVQKAECKKEATQLVPEEELGTCIPHTDALIEVKDYEKNLIPLKHIPPHMLELNTAIIQKRSKHCMQSGTANTHVYVVTFHGGVNWENPLMGWNSGSNPCHATEMYFPSLETAVDYVKTNGWKYYIPGELPESKRKLKNYTLSFSWDKRTRISTK